MPQTDVGLLLAIGALFILIGLLGGGFEISAIKVPRINKIARLTTIALGVIFLSVGFVRLFSEPAQSASQSQATVVSMAPTTVTIDCNLRSTDSKQTSTTIFVNGTKDVLAFYWLDFDGKEVFEFKLEPGDSHSENTFISHPWCIREAIGGKAIQAVIITDTRQTIIIQ